MDPSNNVTPNKNSSFSSSNCWTTLGYIEQTAELYWKSERMVGTSGRICEHQRIASCDEHMLSPFHIRNGLVRSSTQYHRLVPRLKQTNAEKDDEDQLPNSWRRAVTTNNFKNTQWFFAVVALEDGIVNLALSYKISTGIHVY